MKNEHLDILSSKQFNTPIKRKANHFPNVFKKVLLDYIEFTTKIPQGILNAKDKKIIKELSEYLIHSIEEYYNGFNSRSFEVFSNGMEKIRNRLEYTKQFFDNYDYNPKIKTFRVRKGGNELYRPNEMFHIPFQLRHKVSEQRYSISGLPCLYLANSAYTCWLELNKPNLDSFQIAKLEFNYQDLKILDLATTPQSYANLFKRSFGEKHFLEKSETKKKEIINNVENGAIDKLVLWPLMISCLFKVKFSNEGFIPEYIIPKHLLEWVRIQKSLDGIKYVSTKNEEGHKQKHGNLINYAIPVQTNEEKGLCPILTSKFRITETISWQILDLINEDVIEFNRPYRDENNFEIGWPFGLDTLELIKGKPQAYWKTAFGNLEYQLNEMETKQIK